MKYASYHQVEDFILDEDFIVLVRQGDWNKIIALQESYPDKKLLIEEAAIFVRYIKLEQPDIADTQIDEDWKQLSSILLKEKRRVKRRKPLYIWASAAVAAVLIILAVFTYTYNYQLPALPDAKEMMASAMNATEYDENEIRIIAGDTYYQLENNTTLIHTEQGELMLDNNRKVLIDSDYIVVTVPRGRRLNIQFADGTMAWMNAESRVVYPTAFSPDRRDIFMEGEMYLDVATNKEKPFSVLTKNFDVRVTGTEFNVSAYNDDAVNSVVLVEGKVEVSANHTISKLLPNQGFFAEADVSDIRSVDVYPYIAWKEGIMKLDGVPLSEILKKVSRYYGISIHFDKNFSNEIYVGKLDLKESIETVLHNISLSTPFKYTRDNNDIYIK